MSESKAVKVDKDDSDFKLALTFAVKTEDCDVDLALKDERDEKVWVKNDENRPLPKKQRRLLFDGVVVPTLASVRRQKIEEEKDDFKKLSLLKNPKVKKNLELSLLPKTLKDRLKPIGLDIQDQHFTIDQATREVMVTRTFISSEYGGNMQETCPVPSKKFLDIHGMNDFMFLVTEYQPEAPQLPGSPALWLCTAPGPDFARIMRVFVKIVPVSGPKASKYQYVGMYELRAANPPYLTVAEYRAQSSRFHNKWALAITKMGWGGHVCARILLRRELGREPTHVEVVEAYKTGRHSTVTPEDVKTAYFQGKERMGVWTMKCVGYDNDFQRELSQKFPIWAPAPRKKSKKGDKKALRAGRSMVKAEQGTSRTRKRKREDTPETEISEIEVDSEYEDDLNSLRNDVIELTDSDDM